MIRVIRAELVKLTRRRALAAGIVVAVLFAVVATLAVFLAAQPAATAGTGRGVTLEALSDAGGGTRAFAIGASFAGLVVFVTFIAGVTAEFSQGTFRTLLMREPRRLTLLAGRTVALLLLVAGILLVAQVLTLVASLLLAPSQGVSTAEWLTTAGLGDAAGDYGTTFLAVSGWALLGTAIGVVVRSTPIALGIGIAWAGPFEHILQDAWRAAARWFPGLLLEAFAAGGTPEVSMARAAVLLAVYVSVTAAVAATLFARRDMAV